MDVAEFNAYRERTYRTRMVIWWALLLTCAGCGLAIGFTWSFAVGLPLAAMLALLVYEAFGRLSKAHLIKRFPELDDPAIRWHRRDFPRE